MTNPLWLRVFGDVGNDRYLSHAELPSESAARARAVWEAYDRLFGRFTGAGLDPLFHRFTHLPLTIARPVLPRGVPVLVVGTGPSLDGGAEELRRVRSRVLVTTSLRGAVALQARGMHADLVLVEHQTVFDAQTSSDDQRHLASSGMRLHPDTLVLAEPSTPPALLAHYQASRVHLSPVLPTWGLWPATLVALALEADAPAVGLLGIDLGTNGQMDAQHRPLAVLLELLAYASGGCRDCGLFGAHKPGWPRASLTGFAETATHPVKRIDWREERPASSYIEHAKQDLVFVEYLLPDARAALELALQARAGNPPSERDLTRGVEMMLAWGSDPTLRWVLQRAFGLTFLPRFWRTGVRMATPHRLWRPLILALHELTWQVDRLTSIVDEAGRVATSSTTIVASPASPAPPALPEAAAGTPDASSQTPPVADRSRRAADSEPYRATRVSVLLPVKNGLPYLHDAISSLTAQTHPDVEILVIDDGSDDGGPQELSAQALSHVRVIKSNGQGVAAALNTGLRAATGAYVARQDADDWSHPERLARQYEYLLRHTDIDILATCAEFVDREGRLVETTREEDAVQTPEALAELLPLTCAMTHGSIMARRDVLRETGGYRPQAVYAEDYDLWLRLLPRTRFAKLPTRLYTYRLHDTPSSPQYQDIKLRSMIRAKLEFLLRQFPQLTTGARLALSGESRDASAYREIASDLKLEVSPHVLPASPGQVSRQALTDALRDIDILGVIDLDTLQSWVDRFATSEGPPPIRAGNFFVWRLKTGDS